MQEVRIRLRFTGACLGAIREKTRRGQTKFVLPRNVCGEIVFMPSWWRQLMQYAATVTAHYGALVQHIDWAPAIAGVPRGDWQRTVVAAADTPNRRRRYAVHEAFPPGAEITVSAVLPRGLDTEALRELLTVAGIYRGISPFRRDGETYGTFEVVEILPVR
jgi:hypothetical protein